MLKRNGKITSVKSSKNKLVQIEASKVSEKTNLSELGGETRLLHQQLNKIQKFSQENSVMANDT
jgi:hypothetical protein